MEMVDNLRAIAAKKCASARFLRAMHPRPNTKMGHHNCLDLYQGQYSDNCDYISTKYGLSWWINQDWDSQMKIHVPCKDPINLLMSHCFWPREKEKRSQNGTKIGWDCSPERMTDAGIKKQITKMHSSKWSRHKVQPKFRSQGQADNMTLKCFDNNATFDGYINYMDRRLKHRDNPIEINMCHPRLRNRTTECIWKDPTLQERVKAALKKRYYYFQFCENCLLSSNNLVPAKIPTHS